MAAAALVLAAGAASPLQQSLGGRVIGGFPGNALACLDKPTIEKIRSDPNKSLVAAYSACEDELSKRLANFGLDELGLKASFAALAAHGMASYGNSTKLELAELLREEHLDCDNYAALTGHFVGILLPDHPNTFAVVGLDGGKVGNHAQVFLRVAEHRGILADPTVGIIAATGYDNLFSGNPVPPEKVQAFYAYNDPNILKFGNVVYDAITSGGYRPSEMLYYFADLRDFLQFSEGLISVWNGSDVQAVVRAFPTPGAEALKRELSATLHKQKP